jgi:hypothetical protein
MAGPPPFTNESPLLSGMDGIYQAIATGVNLTGVFSFQIVNGIQTSTQSVTINSWVFFVDGNIFQGSVAAAINQTKVAGVLNGGINALPFENGEPLTLPSAFVIPGNTASGDFRGHISLHSPEGAFGGEGTLKGTPERVDQLLFINNPTTIQTITATGTTTTTTTATTQVVPIRIPPAGLSETDFEFQGTRVFTGTSAAPSPTPTPTSSGATTGTTGTTTGTTGTTTGTTATTTGTSN